MTLDLLAFSPHPDDVELHCGGLMIKMGQQGYETGIIDLTAGEMGTRGTVAERAEETRKASEILGIKARENLGIPDSRVTVNDEHKIAIIRMIRRYQPRIILLPSHIARHPDHQETAALVQDAAFLSGLTKIDTDQKPYRPQQLIYYFTHYTYRDQTPSFIVDISAYFPQKSEAIRAYKSQFYNPDSTEPGTYISRPEFLNDLEAQNRYYGSLIGTQYGEPFLIREYLAIDDPVNFFKRSG